MSAVTQLIESLRNALSVELERPAVPPALQREIERLEHGMRTGGGRPPSDRMRAAVSLFRSTQDAAGLAEARLVCFGCVEREAPPQPLLIEEERAFPRLLEVVERYVSEPRAFRRCYRGLLHAYFSYDVEAEAVSETGRRNWEALRTYLETRMLAIHVEGTAPEWVETIAEHRNLLTQDPASRYAAALLNGESAELDQIRSRLEISQESWLPRRMVLAQIERAVQEGDHIFKGRINGLLKMLEGYDLLVEKALSLILNRYAELRAPQEHAALRDFSVGRWGNPWFERKAANWSRVTPVARQLVVGWLKLDLIREFFATLSDDRAADQRRVEFWKRYHEQIHDMYFALGSVARYARGPDAVRLHQRMGNHLLSLRKGGGSANNAFIMIIGDLVAVEFGTKGNACYLYGRDALPFMLSGEVAGDREGLKADRHLDRLRHIDSGYETWEAKFARALSARGIKIDEPRSAPSAPSAPPPSLPPKREERPPPPTSLTPATLGAFARTLRVNWVDHSQVAGNVTVFYDKELGAAADQLRKWGFQFSEQRSRWWRKGWK